MLERYHKPISKRKRTLWAAVAIAAGVAVTAAFAWLSQPSPRPTYHLVSTDIKSADTVIVQLKAGGDAVCVVRALAEDFTPVGWKTVPVTSSPEVVEVELRTTRLAHYAEVKTCW